MNSVELNFDGLVGPTHNYSGLSHGNLASEQNARSISNPKEAVKQGLRKMKTLLEMGIPQGVLPPHERPAVDVLRRLGFSGTEETVIRTASQVAPRVFAACCSASSMWAANAATVSPSADTQDKRVHLTPANLCGQFHRSIETATTAKVLRAIFSGGDYFVHHSPLPCSTLFGDEGAANHTRFCAAYEDPGVELFVYGRGALESTGARPRRYPARQTLEASQALSRLHGLDPEKTVFAQQQPEAIDAGVFHNDVIAVGNQNVLLYHENAFVDTRRVCDEIRRKFGEERLYLIEVGREQISLDEAVKSYLFNSQLVSLPERGMAVLVPAECRFSATVWNYLQELVSEENPICEIKVLDLKQSMRNGGGPACLRLRVVLDEDELWGVNQRVILSQELLEILEAWADRHYRDRLVVQDLADTQLLEESRQALDELTQVLGLGSVYPFQVGGLET